jgi:hypothetical protein
MRFSVLACMDSVDKKYREKEHERNWDSSNRQHIAYHRYMANNGVHPLVMRREQADYLDTFSPNARLFYLAFTHVDGTDGIANGIGRHILGYIGYTLGEAEKRKYKLKEEINSLKCLLQSLDEQIDENNECLDGAFIDSDDELNEEIYSSEELLDKLCKELRRVI